METPVNTRCRPEIYNSHTLLPDRDAGASSSTGRTLGSSSQQSGWEGLGRKGLFQASGKPGGAQQGKQRVALKKPFLKHPFKQHKAGEQLGLSPGRRGNFKQHFQEIAALFPAKGRDSSSRRLQSQSGAQNTGTAPASHGARGQDPTKHPSFEPGGQDPSAHPHFPGSTGSSRALRARTGCLCPTPGSASLISLPHLPLSSMRGV